MEACHGVFLLLVCCGLVQSEPSCDQTEFLHPNDTCVACPVCLPGEQLSEDCGFGDGGEGVCVSCEEGRFSTETGVAPCRRCTRCSVLNRHMERACSPTSDTKCGQCLPGYYELRSMTGEVELLCVPCHKHDTVHKECLLLRAQGSKPEGAVAVPEKGFEEPEETRVQDKTISVVLVGSGTASLVFLVALLLWLCLLTAERFKKAHECCPEPEGLLPGAPLQHTSSISLAKRANTSSGVCSPTEDPTRGLNSLSTENDVHPPSIVINVTTNIKSHEQHEDNRTEEELQNFNTEEMEQKLQTIWEIAQGQSIEMLDYDSVQDLSLLLDSAGSTNVLRRLGWSLGVPPQVVARVQDFQDLFRYLRTSTHTLLPQLAQAAALLPNSAVVSRIHRAVVNK